MMCLNEKQKMEKELKSINFMQSTKMSDGGEAYYLLSKNRVLSPVSVAFCPTNSLKQLQAHFSYVVYQALNVLMEFLRAVHHFIAETLPKILIFIALLSAFNTQLY